MRSILLGAIASIGLAGCCCHVPYCRNAPEYDPSQYGLGPRCHYAVTRGYVGLACYRPPTYPYLIAPPGAGPPRCGCSPPMLAASPQTMTAGGTTPMAMQTATNDAAVPAVRAF